MSNNSRHLCKSILQEVFGDLVAGIGDKLHQWNGQTIQQLMLPPRIPKTSECLTVLINHNLVTFEECQRTNKVIYKLSEERVLALMKFPSYLLLIKPLFGDEAEISLEEIFKSGQISMSNALLRGAKSYLLTKKDETPVEILKKFKNKFIELVDCQFLIRLGSPYTPEDPEPSLKILPKLSLEEREMFELPEINFKKIQEFLEDEELQAKDQDFPDCKILWRLNYERFDREFRDQIIVSAVSRRIDVAAGHLIRQMLNLMNENQAWADISCHLRLNEITDRLDKNQSDEETQRDLDEFKDQYFKILEEDRTRFLDRVGDAGGGQYVINVKHIFTELASATVESIILERYGSKALRIYRVIRQKVHVEESTLQGLVMIPAKETKFLTYNLMEANFIKMQELRKSMASNMGKTFFMFYIDLPQVARMIVDLCYKSIANAFTRKKYEAETNQRLLDKFERIESIAANLKESPELEENEDLQLQLQEIQDMVKKERDFETDCLIFGLIFSVIAGGKG